MILATHALIGAAAISPFGDLHPVVTFLAGYASHLLTDAIPHWDYRLVSLGDQEKSGGFRWVFQSAAFKRDIVHVALDFTAGIGLTWLIAPAPSLPLLCAVLGGMAPDLLQGIYFTRYAPFLKPLQQIHDFFHTELKLGPYPLIGIPFQVLIALAAIYTLT